MTYKVRMRGAPNSLKKHDYECVRCDVIFYDLYVRNSDPTPHCDMCGKDMERMVSWNGATGGLDYGAGFYDSTGREHTSSKDAEDFIRKQRKTRPGEFVGYDRNGKKMFAPEIRHPGAEKHHGARNQMYDNYNSRRTYVPSAGIKDKSDAKKKLYSLLDERQKHG